MSTGLKTPLYDWHVAQGGRIVDFAGWAMPVQYTSIVAEHVAVRTATGLFDISHMGRLWIRGPQAQAFLDRVLTTNVAVLASGQVSYSLVCNTLGGVLDDVLVTRFDAETPSREYLLVVNASNRQKIVAWLETHRPGFDVQIDDETLATGMIAVQGPGAVSLVTPLVTGDAAGLAYYTAMRGHVLGQDAIISRTGYTGEDGFELIVPAAATQSIWETLVAAGARPCGLGSRDTLRLEAAMPLYGHELSEAGDPLSAGLGFAVKFREGGFLGSEALAAVKQRGVTKKRVGLQLAGRRIARETLPVFAGERQIGTVTSGTFSPTLEKSIAMAVVEADAVTLGASVEIEIRGSREPATIVKLPFYKRAS
jgi:aminomethyltransferase